MKLFDNERNQKLKSPDDTRVSIPNHSLQTSSLLNLTDMVGDSALPIVSAIVDGVVVIWRGARGQLLAILPEEISSVAGGSQGGLLPFQ